MSAPKKLHVKTGDRVLIIAGKDKGKKGKVIRVERASNRVVIEGAGIIKKHQRPTQRVMQGGIIEQEGGIHSSNVQLICPKCKKPTRVGRKVLTDGTHVRECKKCGEVIDR